MAAEHLTKDLVKRLSHENLTKPLFFTTVQEISPDYSWGGCSKLLIVINFRRWE